MDGVIINRVAYRDKSLYLYSFVIIPITILFPFTMQFVYDANANTRKWMS